MFIVVQGRQLLLKTFNSLHTLLYTHPFNGRDSTYSIRNISQFVTTFGTRFHNAVANMVNKSNQVTKSIKLIKAFIWGTRFVSAWIFILESF